MAPKNGGKNKILVFLVHIGMQYVSIYVFEGADHEFDTKFGLTPSHNIHQGVPWSLYGPMVFRGSFHGLTRAIFMECMESHGTPRHTTATMAFHGGIHGFTRGISMKYMVSHSISWEYYGASW